MSDWLSQLRNELKSITSQAAKEHWPGPLPDDEAYYNYRLEHVQQVERDAKRLMDIVGGDEDIVLASVWTHDRFQPQFEGDNHAVRAAEWVHRNLAALGFPSEKVHAVEYAVTNHSSHPQTLPDEALEARILWDADKLSKIGALSVVSCLCAIPAFPKVQVGYEVIKQQIVEQLADAEALVNQFYFQLTRDWALIRFEAQKAFCEALEREVDFREV